MDVEQPRGSAAQEIEVGSHAQGWRSVGCYWQEWVEICHSHRNGENGSKADTSSLAAALGGKQT